MLRAVMALSHGRTGAWDTYEQIDVPMGKQCVEDMRGDEATTS